MHVYVCKNITNFIKKKGQIFKIRKTKENTTQRGLLPV